MPILKRSKVLTAMGAILCRRARGPVPRRSSPFFRDHALSLILYQRDDCHLCDLALAVLAAARVPEFESVFIDGEASLEQRYGARVPVLRDAARGVELDWPFGIETLQRWLAT
jgi:Glutaredoxin-like domain (DUF836)